MAEITETPTGLRIHIGFFGRTNSGKSSLINALSGQDVSIVSPEAGTTTDPVYKAIEIAPIGPCVLIDTAGICDGTALGELREERTKKVIKESDILVVLFDEKCLNNDGLEGAYFNTNNKIVGSDYNLYGSPVIPVITKADIIDKKTLNIIKEKIVSLTGVPSEDIICVSSVTGEGIGKLRHAVINAVSDKTDRTILGGMVSEDDIVMLVMPQDKQAPKGRLILPQVTTLRELLDDHARVICVAPEQMSSALSMLKEAPSLIITDSQVFDYVYERKPDESRLTTFSVLYAGLKGDIRMFMEGAKAIGRLKPGARLLIAESCSHAPMEEDIGRVKIPNMIKKRIGGDVTVEVYAGKDFPDDLSGYDLILQCGGCMVNRRQIMNRVEKAVSQGVPITNYGIAIAYLKGILDKITVPSGNSLPGV